MPPLRCVVAAVSGGTVVTCSGCLCPSSSAEVDGGTGNLSVFKAGKILTGQTSDCNSLSAESVERMSLVVSD